MMNNEHDKQEEEFDIQIDYMNRNYPRRDYYIEDVGIINKDRISLYDDMFTLFKEYDIKCLNCGKRIGEGWNVIFHTLADKPLIDIKCFCREDKNCMHEYVEKYMGNK